MMAPRGLAGCALLLWGVCTAHPVIGAVLAIAVEASRFAPARLRIAESALVSIVRTCGLLAFAALLYFILAGRMPTALYAWLRWLPLALVALPIAQAAAGGSIPLAVVARALGVRDASEAAGRTVDFSRAFFAVTLVGAAAAGGWDAGFYAAAAILVGWLLVAGVARRHWRSALTLFVAAVVAGYGVHRGLWLLQGQLEELDPEMLQDFFSKSDPYSERTRIGDIGKIKLSERIVLRVFPRGPLPPQVLLRENAFDRYAGGEWKSSTRSFRPLARAADSWVVRAGEGTARLELRRTLGSTDAVLPLPAGTVRVRLAADSLEMSPTGAVRAKGVPRFLSLDATYDEGTESGTTPADLEVPPALAATLDRVIAENALARATPRETRAAIERFFGANFAYSLQLSKGENARTLADFLLRDRKGHCEYFATATVLLLRRAGIPARYTVGFSAQEWSERERAFLVRHRHAHAWTSAYIDAHWTIMDTTPARWAAEEADAARGPFSDLLDLVSWGFDRFVQWWIGLSGAEVARAISVALAAALLVPLWIFLRKRRARAVRTAARAPVSAATSAWSRIESALARAGYPRDLSETVQSWARRMLRDGPAGWREELPVLARAYYRVRFDPAAGSGDAESFARAASDFVARFGARTDSVEAAPAKSS